jgi:uncharacterized protein YecE (DUF72 family)
VGQAIRIGTAGWSLPKEQRDACPAEGTMLTRYATLFDAAEINSSFYRPHRPTTYARWAASVPESFRFAVKLPKEITHTRRLVDPAEPLAAFLAEIAALGDRLGPVLMQLPPSLAFESGLVRDFLDGLRERYEGPAVCEPRHASWFTDEADALLTEYRVARVAADPARAPAASEPGGWNGLAYYRLHGSPRIYYSAYAPDVLAGIAARLAAHAEAGVPAWCIFDNTVLGAATRDALTIQAALRDAA